MRRQKMKKMKKNEELTQDIIDDQKLIDSRKKSL